jgi:hypothetical protein
VIEHAIIEEYAKMKNVCVMIRIMVKIVKIKDVHRTVITMEYV